MSVDVWVKARRKLAPPDLEYVSLYNSLLDKNIKPPDAVINHLVATLGKDAFYPGESITIPESTETIEILVEGEGDIMYYDGMIIEIADLPPDTMSLRIYAES